MPHDEHRPPTWAPKRPVRPASPRRDPSRDPGRDPRTDPSRDPSPDLRSDPDPRSRHRRGRRRSAIVWRSVTAVSLAIIIVGAARLVPGSPLAAAGIGGESSTTPAATGENTATPPSPSLSPPGLAPLRFRSGPLLVKTEGFVSWALMDRRTGQIWGSKNQAATTWPASMIKAWLVADDLRRVAENGQTPSHTRLGELEAVIRNSDNNLAEATYRRNGRSDSINRLIKMCKLTDTTASSRGWSFTNISARDTVRMADCIGDGTAAGPQWTPWVLDMMRRIRIGDFGIRKALPTDEAAKVSIKNGWLYYNDDRNWHINCMALSDTWAMSVLQRYRGHGTWSSDFAYGQNVCREVAKQLINPEYSG